MFLMKWLLLLLLRRLILASQRMHLDTAHMAGIIALLHLLEPLRKVRRGKRRLWRLLRLGRLSLLLWLLLMMRLLLLLLLLVGAWSGWLLVTVVQLVWPPLPLSWLLSTVVLLKFHAILTSGAAVHPPEVAILGLSIAFPLPFSLTFTLLGSVRIGATGQGLLLLWNQASSSDGPSVFLFLTRG